MISNRTRAILTLTGVFMLGAIAGGAAFHLYLQGQVRDSQSMNDPSSFRGFISERLKLTDAQRDSLRDELGATYNDLAALRMASAEEYDALIDTFSHRVAPQLDGDQRKLLGRLEERMRRRLLRGAVRSQQRPGLIDSLDVDDISGRNHTSAAPVAVDTMRQSVTTIAPRTLPAPSRKNPPPPGAAPALRDSSGSRAETVEDAETGRLGRMLPVADSLRGRLALSPSQLASIRQIVHDTRRNTRAELEKLDGFRRLQKEALNRNLREMDLQIESLLDDHQREIYRSYRREMLHRLREGRKGGDRRRDKRSGNPSAE